MRATKSNEEPSTAGGVKKESAYPPKLKKDPLRTVGAVFRDGAALELVRGPSEPETLNLLHWKRQVLGIGVQVDHEGQLYTPASIEPSVSRALRLPTHVAPQESTRELFAATDELFSRYLNEFENSLMPIIFGIFATWLHEFLPMAPLMWIVIPSASTKGALLRLLHSVCRRPILIGGTRRADFRSLPMFLEPTLLLDEPDSKSAMLGLLQSSNRRGMNILNGKSLQTLYCPKIICSRTIPPDSWLESGALRVVLGPAVGGSTPLSDQDIIRIGESFQARFLGYRLRNSTNICAPEFDISKLTPPTRDLARTFAAAIVGDKELQKRIVPVLCGLDEEIRAERSLDLDAVTSEALFAFTHQDDLRQLRSSQLAERVTAIFFGRGQDRMVSAETVGWSLKRLGIPKERLDSTGNGIHLTNPTRRLIHRLAFSYCVRAMEVGLRSGCAFCEELRRGGIN